MDTFQATDPSVYDYVTMCFRNLPHFILILQMIRFALQGEMIPPLSIRYRITQ